MYTRQRSTKAEIKIKNSVQRSPYSLQQWTKTHNAYPKN